MRNLLPLSLFCLTLTVACKDNGPVGPQVSGGPIRGTADVQGVQGLPAPADGTRSNFAAKLDANGTASVPLPNKPLMIACYINFGDQWWYVVGTAFDGHLDTPWCALSPAGTQWQLSMYSSSNYAGSTAGFIVVY